MSTVYLMNTKQSLVEKTEKALVEEGYNYCRYSGCFDLAARKKTTLLVKVLVNIDAFQEEHSENIRTLSHDIDASPVLIGMRTRYEKLIDNIVYERFNVPTMTLSTFETVISEHHVPLVRRFRGGLFAEVSSEKLRKTRHKAGMTQKELAEKVGVSKKMIYEHEAADKLGINYIVARMEKVLEECVRKKFILEKPKQRIHTRPKNTFESRVGRDLKKIGFETDFLEKTPFNIIAEEKFTLLLEADEKEKAVIRNAPYMVDFAHLIKKPAVIVSDNEYDVNLPQIKREALKEISSSKELLKTAKRS